MMTTLPTIEQQLSTQFQAQKLAYNQQPMPTIAQRRSDLKRLKSALLHHQDALADALCQDYGHRSKDDTLISDILPVINNINYCLKRLAKWMKPSRRHAGLLLAPASVTVHYQPLGVVGVIVPWNFPVMLSLGPLALLLAAGNRSMMKLSEFTPATNQVLKQIISDCFKPDHVAVVEGEAEVASYFSSLAFDHLLFTGSTTVGRYVMRAASENLTPVTLELGGKSPVIIADDMDINTAVERLIYGKCLNAGQICVSPDYILCPSSKVQAFVSAYQQTFCRMYGQVANNPDYGNVINDRQFSRLLGLIDNAKAQGAQVISASGESIDINSRKLATQLVLNVSDDMEIMQDEIFGPLLPIIGYDDLTQAIDYVNNRPRPLALYLMSFDSATQQRVLTQTHSGGVCINETVFHVAADDAPFGGIGPSGMGHYHGHEGFLRFSHAKTVLQRGKLNTGKLIHPPYGQWIQKLLLKFFLR
ncbi:coniferyl aldehyde dehydrogenase [Shewanella sp. NIFS-20-20]|nr:coniferyl aldehyde dehydrogenase [Shewanella sp. NIFS-20-20]MBV7316493.1 coniferyl aldehyde dehydrogenase [Shewanella sp. NIFS-20-20]